MRKFLIILFMFGFFNKSVSANSADAYDYKFNSIDGGQIKLSDYKEKVIVIDKNFVDKNLDKFVKSSDVSRYVL